MVTRGCAGGAVWARADAARLAAKLTAMVAHLVKHMPRSHHVPSNHRMPQPLIIDDYAPGNAADRYRHGCLAAAHVDDGDIVAVAIGDIERALIARQRYAPRALADQDVAGDPARRHVDHRDMGGVAERNERGLAILGHHETNRRDVAFAHARRQELDLA